MESPRRRGAPKGNQNARKHGFYSAINSIPRKPAVPTPADQLQPDIVLFRTLLARVAAALSKGEAALTSFTDQLALLQLVCLAVARINSLWRTNRRLYRDGSGLFDELERLGFTEAQLQSGVFALPKRRRGGQAGNANSLASGLYASPLSPAETEKLVNKENLSMQNELDLLRVLVLRAAVAMRTAEGLDSKGQLKALRVFTQASTLIEKLERRKMPRFGSPQRLDDLLARLDRAGSVLAGEPPAASEAIPPPSPQSRE